MENRIKLEDRSSASERMRFWREEIKGYKKKAHIRKSSGVIISKPARNINPVESPIVERSQAADNHETKSDEVLVAVAPTGYMPRIRVETLYDLATLEELPLGLPSTESVGIFPEPKLVPQRKEKNILTLPRGVKRLVVTAGVLLLGYGATWSMQRDYEHSKSMWQQASELVGDKVESARADTLTGAIANLEVAVVQPTSVTMENGSTAAYEPELETDAASYLQCGPRANPERMARYIEDNSKFLEEKTYQCPPEVKAYFKRNFDITVDNLTPEKIRSVKWEDMPEFLKSKGVSEGRIQELLGTKMIMPYLTKNGQIALTDIVFVDGETREGQGLNPTPISKQEWFMAAQNDKGEWSVFFRMMCHQPAVPKGEVVTTPPVIAVPPRVPTALPIVEVATSVPVTKVPVSSPTATPVPEVITQQVTVTNNNEVNVKQRQRQEQHQEQTVIVNPPQLSPTPPETPTPTPTNTPEKTPTPVPPTPTVRPTIVPQTPIPTFTPGVGPTQTPQPVATRIPTFTPRSEQPTSVPTQTSRPTIVPQRPIPTNTIGVPHATETPRPVATRIPTFTPRPANTVAPTPRPQATARPTIAPGSKL